MCMIQNSVYCSITVPFSFVLRWDFCIVHPPSPPQSPNIQPILLSMSMGYLFYEGQMISQKVSPIDKLMHSNRPSMAWKRTGRTIVLKKVVTNSLCDLKSPKHGRKPSATCTRCKPCLDLYAGCNNHYGQSRSSIKNYKLLKIPTGH